MNQLFRSSKAISVQFHHYSANSYFATKFTLIVMAHRVEQWFPTWVTQHIRVPQGGPRGGVNFRILIDIRPILTPRGAA